MIYFTGSYDKFVSEAINGKPCEGIAQKSRTVRPAFCPIEWEGASAKALNGDIDSAKTISGAFIDCANLMQNTTPRMDIEHTTADGDFIDIARYVSGELECIAKFIDSGKTIRARGFSLGVNMSFNAQTRAEDILRYGGRIAGIAQGLSASGVPVDFYLYFKTSKNSKVSEIIIKMNENGFDLTKCAAAFSDYFLRRIFFAWSENQSKQYCKTFSVGETYGHAEKSKSSFNFDIDLYDAELLHLNQQALVNRIVKKIKSLEGK